MSATQSTYPSTSDPFDDLLLALAFAHGSVQALMLLREDFGLDHISMAARAFDAVTASAEHFIEIAEADANRCRANPQTTKET